MSTRLMLEAGQQHAVCEAHWKVGNEKGLFQAATQLAGMAYDIHDEGEVDAAEALWASAVHWLLMCSQMKWIKNARNN